MSLRGAALLLVSFALVSGCGSEKLEEQDLITFEGHSFTIKLPGKPKITTQNVAAAGRELETTLYTVEVDDAAVVVGVTPLPPGTPFELDGVAPGAAESIRGEVVQVETGEFDGHETRDFVLSAVSEGEDVTVFGRGLMAGGSFVQIQLVLEGKAPSARRCTTRSWARSS